MIHEDARPFSNYEDDVGPLAVLAQPRSRLNRGALVSEVRVLQLNGVDVERQPRRGIRLTGRQLHHRRQLVLGHRRIAFDTHGVDHGLQVLGDLDPDCHRDVLIGRRRTRLDGDLSARGANPRRR